MNLRNVKKDDIVDWLILINIICTYCFDGMPFIGKVSKVFLVMLIVVGFFQSVIKKKLIINWTIILTLLFTCYCYFLKEYQQGEWSRLFGINAQTAITVTLAVMVFTVIYCYADSIEKREKIISHIAVAGVWLSVVTVLLVRTRIFGGLHAAGMVEYLGRYGLQSNQMGVCWGFSLLAGLYLFKQYKKNKYLYYMIINVLFLVLTGSRKALIYLFIGAFVFYVLSGEKNKLFRLLSGVALLYLGYLALIYIPALYNLVGERILSLLDVLNGRTGTDTTSTRFYMVQYGLTLISQNPIWGHGFNFFSVAYGYRHGNQVYSHNNYIEMMVSGGAVLTVLYYSRFFIVIKRLYASLKENNEAVLFIAMMMAMLVADIAAVTYYYRIYYIIFAVASACAYANRNPEKHEGEDI